MGLALKVENLDAVNETLRGHYIEKDGGYVLDVEGMEDTTGLKTALGKERETRKKLEVDLKRFAGVDPEKYQKALDRLEELESGAAGNDKFSEQVEKAVRRKVEPKERELAEARATLERLREERNRHLIGTALRDAVSKVGDVHPTAVSDVINRGMAAFEVDDSGNLVGRGDYSGFSPSEWADALKKDAPHFFQAAKPTGSGSTGGGAGGNAGKVILSREDAKNTAHYSRARDEAEKRGVPLFIEG